MPGHDRYGKDVMRKAVGTKAFTDKGPECKFEFGKDGGSALIDGAARGKIAVEVESRTPKQVRGAIMDLVCHPYKRKLLLLIPARQHQADRMFAQAMFIMDKLRLGRRFRVVKLLGSGHHPIKHFRVDSKEVKRAIKDWLA